MRMTPVGMVLMMSLVAVSSSALDAEAHHPPSETSEGCRDDVLDLPADFVKAKEGPARRVEALADRGEMQSVSPAVQLLAVTLHPAERVRRMATSRREGSVQAPFAGLLAIAVPRDGVYRISFDRPLGIKVLASHGRVSAQAFEIQEGCDRFFKSLAFRLQAGVPYWLELSSNTLNVNVMVDQGSGREAAPE